MMPFDPHTAGVFPGIAGKDSGLYRVQGIILLPGVGAEP